MTTMPPTAGPDTILGTFDDDTIDGLAGDDFLFGSEGDDSLVGSDGDDALDGGIGNDTLEGGNGDDLLSGGVGSDRLDGGAGFDIADYSGDAAGIVIDLAAGTATDGVQVTDTLMGIEAAIGSGLNDAIAGDAAANMLSGSGGNDSLSGLAGNDTLEGGPGNDTLSGGDGIDRVDYAAEINGGIVLNISAGTATDGSGGTDLLTGIEDVNGSDFDDSAVGDAAPNGIAGGGGNDTLTGAAGNDTLAGGTGNDRIDGGAESDIAGYDAASADFRFVITGTTIWVSAPAFGGTGVDRLDGVEAIVFEDQTLSADALTAAAIAGIDGTTATLPDGNDLTNATARNDSVFGGGGSDTIFGDAGNDVLGGSGGNDLIFGGLPGVAGSGADSVLGGVGADTVFGGDGADVIIGEDDLDFLVGDAGDDTIAGGLGDDVLFGGAGNDWLEGEDNVDFLFGDAGADTLVAGAGNDRVHPDAEDTLALGGEGIFDVLVPIDNAGNLTRIELGNALNQNQTGTGPQVSGFEAVDASIATAPVSVTGAVLNGNGNVLFVSPFDDTVVGSALGDIILGNAGADSIDGGSGNDTLIADADDDTLTGGTGADEFFYPGGGREGEVTITDFAPGTDLMQLSAVFGLTAAQARAQTIQQGADAVLSLGPDAAIVFAGVSVATLTAADFEIV